MTSRMGGHFFRGADLNLLFFKERVPDGSKTKVAVFARGLAPPLPVFIGRVSENKPPACFRSAYFARTTKSLESAEFSGLFYSS